MKHNIQDFTPEEHSQFLEAVHDVAKHMAQACEEAVIRLLSEHGGCLVDFCSPTINMGVLIAPTHMIKQAKAHLMSENEEIGSAKTVEIFTQAGQDPTAEPMN